MYYNVTIYDKFEWEGNFLPPPPPPSLLHSSFMQLKLQHERLLHNLWTLFQKCQKPFFFFKKPFRVNLNPGGGIAILNLNNWMFTMKNRHFMMSDSKVQKMLKKIRVLSGCSGGV